MIDFKKNPVEAPVSFEIRRAIVFKAGSRDRCGASSARVNQNREMSGIHLEKVSGGRENLETPRESYLVQAEWMKS